MQMCYKMKHGNIDVLPTVVTLDVYDTSYNLQYE